MKNHESEPDLLIRKDTVRYGGYGAFPRSRRSLPSSFLHSPLTLVRINILNTTYPPLLFAEVGVVDRIGLALLDDPAPLPALLDEIVDSLKSTRKRRIRQILGQVTIAWSFAVVPKFKYLLENPAPFVEVRGLVTAYPFTVVSSSPRPFEVRPI